jgi:hypothetical protein
MHLTSAAAQAVARKLVAQHPDALFPAQVIRQPGLHATYTPAVRLRVGAEAPAGIKGVVVLEAEPEALAEPVKVKAPKAPKPPPPKRDPVNRVGQTDKMVGLLRRPGGVSSEELVKAMGVKAHTTRALLSRLRRKMTIERGEDGRYRGVSSQ